MDLWRPYCRNKGTFRLAREFMDNFLRVTPQVPTDKLQLVGITCLYMSCRALESSWRPFELLETLTDLTDDAVTRDEVLKLITVSGELDGRPIPSEDFKYLGWSPETGNTHIQELEPELELVREPEQQSQGQESQESATANPQADSANLRSPPEQL